MPPTSGPVVPPACVTSTLVVGAASGWLWRWRSAVGAAAGARCAMRGAANAKQTAAPATGRQECAANIHAIDAHSRHSLRSPRSDHAGRAQKHIQTWPKLGVQSVKYLFQKEKASTYRAPACGMRRGLPVNVMMQASIRPSTSKVPPSIDSLYRLHARAATCADSTRAHLERIVQPRRAMIVELRPCAASRRSARRPSSRPSWRRRPGGRIRCGRAPCSAGSWRDRPRRKDRCPRNRRAAAGHASCRRNGRGPAASVIALSFREQADLRRIARRRGRPRWP